MELLSSVLPVVAIHLLAVVSPGPDFTVVVKNSLARGRRHGLATAMGITIGITAHLAYSFLGIGFLIAKSILLFTIVKYCGAAYLLYIGIQALRSHQTEAGAPSVIDQDARASIRRSFTEGLLTNLLNPKATLFFVGIFSQFIEPSTPLSWYVGVTVGIVLNQLWWFSAVALLFSAAALQHRIRRVGVYLDRGMGAVLIALGIKVALSER